MRRGPILMCDAVTHLRAAVITMMSRRRPPARSLVAALVTALVAVAASVVADLAVASPVVGAAEATDPARFVPVEPCRLRDTRLGGRLVAGGTVDIAVAGLCGIPVEAVAAALTITAVDPTQPGFVTVWPGDESRPETSVVNFRPGQVVANAQLVRVDAAGMVRAFSPASTDLLVDVTGYFVPADGPVRSGRYVPVEPRRLVDTRASGKPSVGGAVTVRPDVPSGAVAVAVNIATSDSSAPGFFTAYATGDDRPTASVLNTDLAGQTRAAAAIVPLAAGAFDVYTHRGDHVIVDIAGYFTGDDAPPSADGLFVGTAPTRLVDTRLAWSASGGPRLWDGGEREFDVAAITGGPVAAIAANVTVTAAEDAGYVVAGPARTTPTTTSAVNADRAQLTVANAAIVGVSTAGVSFEALEATHLVVDVTGWFTGSPVAATAAAPVNSPPADRRVVVISDSAMAGVRWNGALGGFQGFAAEPLLESCRRLVQASCRGREGYIPRTAQGEILAQRQAGPEDILVISVGYNDWHDRFASDFDTVIAAARARGFHHVAWVNYRSQVGYSLPGTNGSQSNYGEMNRILGEKVASGAFPEVRLWDFDRYTTPAPAGWFAGDGVHETTLGSWGVADWVSRHVRAFDDRPCVRPWMPGAAAANPCPDPDPLPATIGVPAIGALYGV